MKRKEKIGDVEGFAKDERRIYEEAASADWRLQQVFKKDRPLQPYVYDWLEVKVLFHEETARIHRDLYEDLMDAMERHQIEREEPDIEHHMRAHYARPQEDDFEVPDERDLDTLSNRQLIILLAATVDTIVSITQSEGEASVQYLYARAQRLLQRMSNLDEERGGGGGSKSEGGNATLVRSPRPRP